MRDAHTVLQIDINYVSLGSSSAAHPEHENAACCYRCSVVCRSVCLWVLVTTVSHAKTAEEIEMPFGMWTPGSPRNHALCGAQIFPRERTLSGVTLGLDMSGSRLPTVNISTLLARGSSDATAGYRQRSNFFV